MNFLKPLDDYKPKDSKDQHFFDVTLNVNLTSDLTQYYVIKIRKFDTLFKYPYVTGVEWHPDANQTFVHHADSYICKSSSIPHSLEENKIYPGKKSPG